MHIAYTQSRYLQEAVNRSQQKIRAADATTILYAGRNTFPTKVQCIQEAQMQHKFTLPDTHNFRSTVRAPRAIQIVPTITEAQISNTIAMYSLSTQLVTTTCNFQMPYGALQGFEDTLIALFFFYVTIEFHYRLLCCLYQNLPHSH
jgi:hypothetical protein